MIKINLALRKQATLVDARSSAGGGAGLSLNSFDSAAALSVARDPMFRRVVLGIVAAFMATYLLDGYKNDQLQALDRVLEKINAENSKAKAELAKTSGYEAMKKQFDADEEMIKTKLATIQKLMSDRQTPPKLMYSVANGIPKEVWLSEFVMTDQDVKLKGSSLGFDQITDFMKTLSDNEFLGELKLGNSQKVSDNLVGEIETFELEAKRK